MGPGDVFIYWFTNLEGLDMEVFGVFVLANERVTFN